MRAAAAPQPRHASAPAAAAARGRQEQPAAARCGGERALRATARRGGASRRAKRILWAGLCLGLLLPAAAWWRSRGPRGELPAEHRPTVSRRLLQTPTAFPRQLPTTPPTSYPQLLFTTVPTVPPSDGGQLYPPEAFSIDEVKQGAVLFYIFGVFYMFAALAIICDDYFVPALEVITERLALSEDVAGATFMAAGGSAPELFTSLIGVFIAKSNVGFGTIVGSAVFNVLFVIGACAVATRKLAALAAREHERATGETIPFMHQGLPLTWWPLARDSFFYGIDLVVLLIFFLDEEIWWWEALIQLALYACYVLFMKYNEDIQGWVTERLYSKVGTRDDAIGSSQNDASHHEGGRRGSIKAIERDVRREQGRHSHEERRRSSGAGKGDQVAAPAAVEAAEPVNGEGDEEEEEEEEDEGGPWSPGSAWEEAETGVDKFKYFFFFPLNIVLWLTVPNCQDDEKKKWYIVAFGLSIAWIGFFSYLMVWWADVIGIAADIPPEVMGLTFLAAGTSVPDLITSVVVARAGHGDMAVSSSIGSNIFDICFGLPLPWFLYGVTVNRGSEPIDVTSNSLGSSVLMLFGMLVATIICIVLFGWKLNALLGATSVVLYCIFMTFTLLIEYELIGGIQ
eukprot:TRINITY_DN125_c0_g1_i2.p1 TRINITY_DN125_c0_g1~~TRINITY_DN125_c0_g1_i2.p1  ORF type:complete len:664 (+),score=236.39 TRINITY_DN125_c0_g1_i2:118-1992(+)